MRESPQFDDLEQLRFAWFDILYLLTSCSTSLLMSVLLPAFGTPIMDTRRLFLGLGRTQLTFCSGTTDPLLLLDFEYEHRVRGPEKLKTDTGRKTTGFKKIAFDANAAIVASFSNCMFKP